MYVVDSTPKRKMPFPKENKEYDSNESLRNQQHEVVRPSGGIRTNDSSSMRSEESVMTARDHSSVSGASIRGNSANEFPPGPSFPSAPPAPPAPSANGGPSSRISNQQSSRSSHANSGSGSQARTSPVSQPVQERMDTISEESLRNSSQSTGSVHHSIFTDTSSHAQESETGSLAPPIQSESRHNDQSGHNEDARSAQTPERPRGGQEPDQGQTEDTGANQRQEGHPRVTRVYFCPHRQCMGHTRPRGPNQADQGMNECPNQSFMDRLATSLCIFPVYWLSMFVLFLFLIFLLLGVIFLIFNMGTLILDQWALFWANLRPSCPYHSKEFVPCSSKWESFYKFFK